MKRLFCYFLGHYWRDEKEFVSCGRCHASKSKRDLDVDEIVHRWL